MSTTPAPAEAPPGKRKADDAPETSPETSGKKFKTTTEQRRYRSYRDLAVQPLSLGGLELPPLLLIALLLLASEQILIHTRFRTLP